MSQLLKSALTPEQRAEAQRHDDHAMAEQARTIRGEPYLWPFPWRTAERRQMPRASRWGDLT